MTAQSHDRKLTHDLKPDRLGASGPLHMILQTLADSGGIAADAGGAIIALELMLGSPGSTAMTVELFGCALAALAGFGQACLGDDRAIERTGRMLLNRGVLRLMPDTLRKALGDRLFGAHWP